MDDIEQSVDTPSPIESDHDLTTDGPIVPEKALDQLARLVKHSDEHQYGIVWKHLTVCNLREVTELHRLKALVPTSLSIKPLGAFFWFLLRN